MTTPENDRNEIDEAKELAREYESHRWEDHPEDYSSRWYKDNLGRGGLN